MADDLDVEDLPFDCELVEKSDDKVLIRSKIKCEADADAWLTS